MNKTQSLTSKSSVSNFNRRQIEKSAIMHIINMLIIYGEEVTLPKSFRETS